MLSPRGHANATSLTTPWKYLPKLPPYSPTLNPKGYISFATAENALINSELTSFAAKVPIPSQAFRYAGSTDPALPNAFAAHVNECFKPWEDVRGEEVKVTAAATALHSVLARALASEGEGILITRPFYGRFEIDFELEARVRVVKAETGHEGCFEESVVEVLEEAVRRSEEEGVKVRALMVVNPHNPLGRCYLRTTLIALLHFCQKHNLHLISDEIYALSVFANPNFPDAAPFTSILSIDTTDIIDADRVHVIYGLSKDFGAAGLKVGALISRNSELRDAVQAVTRFHGVSGASVAIATAMLEDRVWCRAYIALARERIRDAYIYATGRFDDMGISYFAGGNAGFFLWVDFGPLLPLGKDGVSAAEREQALATKFLEKGVVLQPGEEHSVAVGWFRIVFTMEREVVEEGFRRMEEVVREMKW